MLLIIAVLGISACNKDAPVSSNRQEDTSSFDPLQAPDAVKSAYMFAKDNQELLRKFYCVCPCMKPPTNHKSLKSCYIKDTDSNGNITYDSHGATCKACLDEAMDLNIWTEKGLEFKEIVKLYDEKYGNLNSSPKNWDYNKLH